MIWYLVLFGGAVVAGLAIGWLVSQFITMLVEEWRAGDEEGER